MLIIFLRKADISQMVQMGKSELCSTPAACDRTTAYHKPRSHECLRLMVDILWSRYHMSEYVKPPPPPKKKKKKIEDFKHHFVKNNRRFYVQRKETMILSYLIFMNHYA